MTRAFQIREYEFKDHCKPEKLFFDYVGSLLVDSSQVFKMFPAQVTCIHFSPVDSNLMLSSGNDWNARLFDLRKLSNSPASPGDKGDRLLLALRKATQYLTLWGVGESLAQIYMFPAMSRLRIQD